MYDDFAGFTRQSEAADESADARFAKRYTALAVLMSAAGAGALGIQWFWWVQGRYLPNVTVTAIVAFFLGVAIARLAGRRSNATGSQGVGWWTWFALGINAAGAAGSVLLAVWAVKSGAAGDRSGLFMPADDPLVQQLAKELVEDTTDQWSRMVDSPDPEFRLAALSAASQQASRLPFKKVIEPVAPRLRDPEPAVRIAAIDLVGRYGVTAYPTVDTLLTAISDDHHEVASQSVLALLQIAPHRLCDQDNRVVLHLCDATLPENSIEVCKQAAYCLGALRRAPDTAVPALAAMLNDNEPSVRAAAAFAMAEFGVLCKGNLRTAFLLAATQNRSPVVADRGAWALAQWKSDAADDLPALLTQLLSEPNKNDMLAYTIASIGPEVAADVMVQRLSGISGWHDQLESIVRWWGDRSVLPILVPLLDSQPRDATRLLAILGPEAADAVPALRNRLKQTPPDASMLPLLQALAAIGPAAIDVEPELAALREAEDATVSCETAWALWCIRPDEDSGRLAAERLAEQLSGTQQRRQDLIEYRLRSMGPAAYPATHRLVAMVKSNDDRTQRAALRVLASIGPAAKPAVPTLIASLHSEVPEIQRLATIALGEVGPAAASAAGDLTKLLKTAPSPVRLEAIWTLRKIGADARAAAPALQEIVRRANLDERLLAIAALQRIDPPTGQAIRAAYGVHCSMWNGYRWIEDNHGREPPRKPLEPGVVEDVIGEIVNWTAHSHGVSANPGPAAAEYRQRLRQLGEQGEPGQAETALNVLLNIRPLDQAATIDLVHAMEFLGTRHQAMEILSQRDLRGELDDIQNLFCKGPPLRSGCAAYAWWLAASDPAAVKYLVEQVEHPDPFVAQAAVEFLEAIGPPAAAATESLLRRVEPSGIYGDPLAPIEAAQALAAIGPDARAAVPRLRQLTESPDTALRLAAIDAIARIADDAQVVASLRQAAQARDPKVRDAVFTALARHVRGSPEAVRIMVAICLRDAERRATSGAAGAEAAIRHMQALGELKQTAAAAEPYLLNEIRYGASLEVKAEAAFALWQITDTPWAVPVLLELLSQADRHCEPICRRLGQMGQAARHSIPDLVRLIGNRECSERWAAMEAALKMGPDAQAAIPAIRRQVTADETRVAATAAFALWQLKDDGEAVRWLIALLNRDTEDEQRRFAAEFLGQIGPEAQEAVPVLERSLYDPDYELARAAATALRNIAPAVAAEHGIAGSSPSPTGGT